MALTMHNGFNSKVDLYLPYIHLHHGCDIASGGELLKREVGKFENQTMQFNCWWSAFAKTSHLMQLFIIVVLVF
jgi:hypothetical protein